MIEVEIRSKVSKLAETEKKIITLGAKYISKTRVLDKVYGRERDLDDSRMVKEGCFSARIRAKDDRVKLEFKEIRRNGIGIEISSPLGSVEQGEYFLASLDYLPAFSIDKIRTVYKYKDFEISLDEVSQLGEFIEIEHQSKDGQDTEAALKACEALLNQIDPSAVIEARKYGDLMQSLLNKDENAI